MRAGVFLSILVCFVWSLGAFAAKDDSPPPPPPPVLKAAFEAAEPERAARVKSLQEQVATAESERAKIQSARVGEPDGDSEKLSFPDEAKKIRAVKKKNGEIATLRAELEKLEKWK